MLELVAGAGLLLLAVAFTEGVRYPWVYVALVAFFAAWAWQAVDAYRRAVELGGAPGGAIQTVLLAPIALVVFTGFWLVGGTGGSPAASLRAYVAAWRDGRPATASRLFVAQPQPGALAAQWASQQLYLRGRATALARGGRAEDLDPSRPLDALFFDLGPVMATRGSTGAEETTATATVEFVRQQTVSGSFFGLFPTASQRRVVLERVGSVVLRAVERPSAVGVPDVVWRIESVSLPGASGTWPASESAHLQALELTPRRPGLRLLETGRLPRWNDRRRGCRLSPAVPAALTMPLSGFYDPRSSSSRGRAAMAGPAATTGRTMDTGVAGRPGALRDSTGGADMSLIRRTSPFGELLSLRQAMDRLFEDSFVQPRAFARGDVEQGLPLDIRMTEEELVLTAPLPGVKPEDVDISITGDTLTITGKTEEEKRDEREGYLYQEIRRGTFSRSVALPSGLKVDETSARFENGMLTLTIPKAEEAKPRQIKISPTSEGTARQVGASQAAGSAQSSGSAQSGGYTQAAGSDQSGQAKEPSPSAAGSQNR